MYNYTETTTRIGRVHFPEIGVDFSIDWNQLVFMKKYSLTLLLYLEGQPVIEICAPTSQYLNDLYEKCFEQWTSA
jgi:hypothetical protein